MHEQRSPEKRESAKHAILDLTTSSAYKANNGPRGDPEGANMSLDSWNGVRPLAMRRLARRLLGCGMLLLCTHAFASNTPIDTDGDGDPDFVSVLDWDNDGVLEMLDDIQAAIDSLTDSGHKIVMVEPGSYLPPPPNSQNILQLPSDLELVGFGAGLTILNGFEATDLTSVGAVLANADFSLGNSNVTVRDLEINGGWASGDATGLVHHRMGVYFNKCANCRVESTTVRDTLHTCLYSKNGTGVYFNDNTLLQCGNYSGAGGERYSCVYLFANDGFVQESVYVTDNFCDGSGAEALNTRRESPAAFLRNIHFSGNTVQNTRAEATYARRCIIVKGVDGGFYSDNVCTNTGSFFYYSEAYYSDGTYAAASRDIHVDGLMIIDPVLSNGVEIHGYLEQSTFRNIEVRNLHPERDCLVVNNPLKNVTFDDITLENCGRIGIYESLPRGSGPTVEEGLIFRRIDISTVDGDRLDGIARPAVQFRGPARNLTLDGMTITDVTGDGIVFDSDLSDSTLRNIVITEVGGDGIALGPSAVVDTVDISSNTVDGSGARGINLQLDPAQSSQGLEVSRNTIRDFGRNSPGSSTAVGIEISGAAGVLDLSDNLLEDVGNQGQYGIVHDVSPLPVDTTYLCTNQFSGTLALYERLWTAATVGRTTP